MNCVILADLINRQDVRMIEPDHGVRFLLKALQALGVARKTQGQQFERSLAASDNVGGQIDFTHPACAYRLGNFVVTNRLADERVTLPSLNNLRREPNR